MNENETIYILKSCKARKQMINFPCVTILFIVLAIYTMKPLLTYRNVLMISTQDNFGARLNDISCELDPGQAHIFEDVKPYKQIISVDSHLSRRIYQNCSGLERDDRIILEFFFNDYLKFHKANRFSGDKYLIFSPQPGAGIGDRASWFAMAYWMAVLSRRIILLDGNSLHPLSALLHSAQPDLKLFLDEYHDTARNVTLCITRHGCHTKRLNASRRANALESERSNEGLLLSDTKTVLFDCNTSLHVTSKFLKCYSPKEIPAAMIEKSPMTANYRRLLFSRVLRLRNRKLEIGDKLLRKKRDSFFSEYSKLFKRKTPLVYQTDTSGASLPYVSVHARLGEGLGEYESRFEQGINKKHELAQCLAKKAVSLVNTMPHPRIIFLATDTSSFRKMFDREVQSAQNSKNILVLWNNQNISHSVSWRKYTDVEREENTLTLLDDIFMLGKAKHMIAIYSLFARFSFFSGCSENLIEIDLKNCISQ